MFAPSAAATIFAKTATEPRINYPYVGAKPAGGNLRREPFHPILPGSYASGETASFAPTAAMTSAGYSAITTSCLQAPSKFAAPAAASVLCHSRKHESDRGANGAAILNSDAQQRYASLDEYKGTRQTHLTPQVAMNIFVSYSRKDSEWVSKIRAHLAPLGKERALVLLSDMDILPGQNWNEQIKKFLEFADIAIVLVSPSYLASDFIRTNELPSLLREAQEGRLRVIPILIRDSILQGEILKWKFLNQSSEPLASLSSLKQETYFRKLSETIRHLANERAHNHKINGAEKSLFDRVVQSAVTNAGYTSVAFGGGENIFVRAEREVGN